MKAKQSWYPAVVRNCRPSGFTVLELLVSVAVIGILMGLLFPTLGAARESARRIQCVSNLREIGLALHHHHDSVRRLLPGWEFDPSNQTAYGWTVALLPYLSQSGLAERIDGDIRVDAPQHSLARSTPLEVMLCPSDITLPMFTLFGSTDEEDENDHGERGGKSADGLGAVSFPTALVQLPTANYAGVFGTIDPDLEIPAPIGDGVFLENRPTRYRDFSRGLSNTIIVGERTMAQVPTTWLGVSLAGEDAAARLVGATLEGINHPLADECDYSSRHPGGANFLWGDGHVKFVTEQIDLREYHRMPKLHSSGFNQ